MMSISAAVAHVCAHPAPVLLLDTCSLLDLFRRDSIRKQPRVPAEEIRTAAKLLQLVTARPDAVNLIVPELVPREFADHASEIEQEFVGWLQFYDDNQNARKRFQEPLIRPHSRKRFQEPLIRLRRSGEQAHG